MAVPRDVMQHVVHVESAFNPYAIGVVGGRLARQPKTLAEALATVRMLEARGYNFSVGLAQVNRHNLARYGLASYERAFESCPNLQAGSRILAACHARSGGDWGKSFSCYYSGNFTTGFRHGYVQKVLDSMHQARPKKAVEPIDVVEPSANSPKLKLMEPNVVRESRVPEVEPNGRRAAVSNELSRSAPRLDTNRTTDSGIAEVGRPSNDDAFVF